MSLKNFMYRAQKVTYRVIKEYLLTSKVKTNAQTCPLFIAHQFNPTPAS